MAFEGDETGRHIPHDAPKATAITTIDSAPAAMGMASGTRMFAVAVALMKFARAVVAYAITKASSNGERFPNGIWLTIHCDNPVAVTACPSARPPAIRNRTS